MNLQLISYLALGLLPCLAAFTPNLSRRFVPFCDATDDGRRATIWESLASFGLVALLTVTSTPSVSHAISPLIDQREGQGIPLVTQSDLGESVRYSIVRGAQLVDRLDLQWERLSDGLRDERKCDPGTNRRLFDNGFRKDGTRVGNPVLGALCTPETLQDLDAGLASTILDLGDQAAVDSLRVDIGALKTEQQKVESLVLPAFARSVSSEREDLRRQAFNRDLYIRTRTYGRYAQSKGVARTFERAWGDQMLASLAPRASREDFNSPFPKPDSRESQPYDEEALLDALGALSVALEKLQAGGLIGHWEISIPEDDDWDVVTIAVDDDISVGGQILGRESSKQLLSGSEVVSLVRSAMESRAKISYKLDDFFVDPTTTRQELYNPTQLLISLSGLGQ